MEGIINHKDSLPVTKVVLIDIPEGEEKVSINTAFAKRMVEKALRTLPLLSHRSV